MQFLPDVSQLDLHCSIFEGTQSLFCTTCGFDMRASPGCSGFVSNPCVLRSIESRRTIIQQCMQYSGSLYEIDS